MGAADIDDKIRLRIPLEGLATDEEGEFHVGAIAKSHLGPNPHFPQAEVHFNGGSPPTWGIRPFYAPPPGQGQPQGCSAVSSRQSEFGHLPFHF